LYEQDIIKPKDADFDIQQASIMISSAAMVVAWGIPITLLPTVTPFQRMDNSMEHCQEQRNPHTRQCAGKRSGTQEL